MALKFERYARIRRRANKKWWCFVCLMGTSVALTHLDECMCSAVNSRPVHFHWVMFELKCRQWLNGFAMNLKQNKTNRENAKNKMAQIIGKPFDFSLSFACMHAVGGIEMKTTKSRWEKIRLKGCYWTVFQAIKQQQHQNEAKKKTTTINIKF